MRRSKLFLFGLTFSLSTLACVAAPAASSTPDAQDLKLSPAEEPTVKAIAKVMPAVVNVNTERVVRRTYRDPYDEYFYHFFGERPRAREVRQTVQSLGSGFIVDPSGYIVTNEHVVERAEDLKIQVTTPDGKTYDAQYITGDAEADLALLKIESPEPLPYISLTDISPNLLGQTALVVGNPLGYGHSVARGILSATGRNLVLGDMEFKNLLQTDAAINPGNSGGPLIDLSGKLIGVASAKMAYTPQGVPTQGIGFAIPAETVAKRIEAFKEEAKSGRSAKVGTGLASAARQRLGLTLQDLTPDLSDALGLNDTRGGVLIADVEEGSPAAQAGLKRGIVLYRVGRFDVARAADVESLLQKARRGTEIDLGIGISRQIAGRTLQQISTVSLTAR